jgi:uncharacterized protein (TIGR02466 family)
MIDSHFSVPVYSSVVEDNLFSVLKNDVYSYIQNNEAKINNFNTSDWDCNTISSITAEEQFKSEALENILKTHFNSYLTDLNVAAHVTTSGMWVNIADPGSYQEQHNHIGNNNIFSGVIWIDAKEDSGDLIFRNPYNNLLNILPKNTNIHSRVIYRPYEKGICLFPAFLEHSVRVNKSGSRRISVSFNIAQIINKNV